MKSPTSLASARLAHKIREFRILGRVGRENISLDVTTRSTVSPRFNLLHQVKEVIYWKLLLVLIVVDVHRVSPWLEVAEG